MRELLEIAGLAERAGRAALATVIGTSGSTYRKRGARLLISEDGSTAGIISGGCIENDLLERARAVMRDGSSVRITYSPRDDDPLFALGAGCGGEVTVLIEPLDAALRGGLAAAASALELRRSVDVALRFEGNGGRTSFGERGTVTGDILQTVEPPLALVVFGAGADARPMAGLAASLGWTVTVADHRAAFARPELFPPASRIVVAPVESLAEKISFDSRTAAVLMTHNIAHDAILVRALLPRHLPYLGLLGPRSRREAILATLASEGFAPGAAELATLHGPAGLDLRGESPEGIALSVVSEIEAVMNGGSGLGLRDRPGPIHDVNAARGDVAIVVLAAGESKRLGEPKQLLPFQGTTLLRRAVLSALQSSQAVCVVLGSRAARMRREIDDLPADVMVNRQWKKGIGSSVRAGVRAVEKQFPEARAALLMLVDQPTVTPVVLGRLISAFRATGGPIAATSYPEGAGVPALFAREMFPMLRSLEGDMGARELIRRFSDQAVVVGAGDVPDIDTPADPERVDPACERK